MFLFSFYLVMFLGPVAIAGAMVENVWPMRRVFLAISWTPLAALVAVLEHHLQWLETKLGYSLLQLFPLIAEISLALGIMGGRLIAQESSKRGRVCLMLATILAATPAIYLVGVFVWLFFVLVLA